MSTFARRLALAAGRFLAAGIIGVAVGGGIFGALGALSTLLRLYGPQSIIQMTLVGAVIGLVAGPVLGMLRFGKAKGALVEGLTPALLYCVAAVVWLNRESGVFPTLGQAIAYVAGGAGMLLLGGALSGYVTSGVLPPVLDQLEARYGELEMSPTNPPSGSKRYRI